MSTPNVPPMSRSLQRITLDTPFHIDLSWWKEQDKDLHIFMREICLQYGIELESIEDAKTEVDLIDPNSGEVTHVSKAYFMVRTRCATRDDFITTNSSLVDALFKAFLANGNQPMTVTELAAAIGKPQQAATILRTIGGRRIYSGMRPFTAK